MNNIIEFVQTWGWQIASILFGAVVFYDRYIAPITKTKKDDEILEKLLEFLPDALEERLIQLEEEAAEAADKKNAK